MSNCINSGINKVYILTQFNSASLNRHLARAYNFGSGGNFGDGYVEVHHLLLTRFLCVYVDYLHLCRLTHGTINGVKVDDRYIALQNYGS